MRKLTAAISATTIAATLIVPITAGAATTQKGALTKNVFSYDFTEPVTKSDWTFSPSTTTDDQIKQAQQGGALILNSAPAAITKSNQKLYGDFTVRFDITTGSTVDNFIVQLGSINIVDVYSNKLRVKGDDMTNAQNVLVAEIGTGTNKTPELLANKTYKFSVTVDDKKAYLTITGDVFNNVNLKVTDYPINLSDIKTTSFKFQNNTKSAGITIDNISVDINPTQYTADNITNNKLENQTVNITSYPTQYFTADSSTLKLIKDNEEVSGTSVDWKTKTIDEKSYNYDPTITIPENLPAGNYSLVLYAKDIYGRINNNVTWTFTVDAAETAASAETVAAAAANIESSNIRIDDGKVIKDGTVMQFYKTTVTAGTKKVNGGEITAKVNDRSVTNQFGIVVEPGKTGVFYNLVGVDGSQASDYNITPVWSYTFNEE